MHQKYQGCYRVLEVLIIVANITVISCKDIDTSTVNISITDHTRFPNYHHYLCDSSKGPVDACKIFHTLVASENLVILHSTKGQILKNYYNNCLLDY